MNWTFKNIDTHLKNLQPKVKEKALQIAGELNKNKNYSEEEALIEGIKRAEEWFYNLEG